MADEPEQSYEANTVEELKDELRARDLPTSGHKDELVARLEEDDTVQSGGTSQEVAVQEVAVQEGEGEEEGEEAEVAVEGPVNAIHRYQLPANSAVAQQYMDSGAVALLEDDAPFPEELVAAAQQAIADYGDAENDPRMEGYSPPEEAEEEAPVPVDNARTVAQAAAEEEEEGEAE